MSVEDRDSDSTLSDDAQGRRSSMSSCPDMVNHNDFSDSEDELYQDGLVSKEAHTTKADKGDKPNLNTDISEDGVLNQERKGKSIGRDQHRIQNSCTGSEKDSTNDKKNRGDRIDNVTVDSLTDTIDKITRTENVFNVLTHSFGPSDAFDSEDDLADSDGEDVDYSDIDFDSCSDEEWLDYQSCDLLHMFNWSLPEDLDDTDQNVISQDEARTAKSKIFAALKAKTGQYPRIFHTKTNPGRVNSDDISSGSSSMKTQLYANSPLHMLANIAKASNKDITELMDSSESMNETLRFPCMQCYEQKSTSGQGYGASMRGYGAGLDGGYGGSSAVVNGRCTLCGGSVMTVSTFCKAIKKMRAKLKAEQLLIKDTYPDGNCLFGSIVDQLNIRGDFRFTVAKLRAAAVNYLRMNPLSEDGTPYEMFLTGETWESFLARMSQDGVWGDHMVLSAIASLLSCRIVILSGIDGAGETIINPRGYNQSKGPLLDTIYLGHLGESHYLSLRPKNWKDELIEKVISLSDTSHDADVHDKNLDKLSSRLLPIHTDTILKTLFLLEYVTSPRKDVIDIVTPGRYEDEKFVYEMMGNLINKVEPCICKVEGMGPPIEAYFPGLSDEITNTQPEVHQITLYCSPNDTKAMFNPDKASCLDLVCHCTDLVGVVTLSPVDPKVWGSTAEQQDDGSFYLKTFTVEVNTQELFPILQEFTNLNLDPVIAFTCRWPDEAFDWISRQRKSHLLSEELIEEIVVGGCHVVPLRIANKQKESIWSISFSAAEKVILKRITPSQQNCFLLLQLYIRHLCSEPAPFEVVTKSLFLYACEEIDMNIWEKHPGSCVISVLQNLVQGLKGGVIPHFFMQRKNLLESVSKKDIQHVFRIVESFCKQPFVGLYFFLDQFNITTTEVAPILEGIMEDLCSDSVGSGDFFHRVILPSLSSMLSDLVPKEEYRESLIVADNIRADVKHYTGINVSMKDILSNSLLSIHIGMQWCFALYIDISRKTQLTKELLEYQETVSIRQIFGPECTEDLPDTKVNVCFSIAYGDLNYPSYVQRVLLKLGKIRAIITCLRYYVDTLNEIAGDQLVIGLTSKRGELLLLYELYHVLYQAYSNQNNAEEFRDLIPVMTKIVEALNYPNYEKELNLIKMSLGITDNAVSTRRTDSTSNNMLLLLMYGKDESSTDLNLDVD